MNTENTRTESVKYLVAINPMMDQHPCLDRGMAALNLNKLNLHLQLFVSVDPRDPMSESSTDDIRISQSQLNHIIEPIPKSGASYEIDYCWTQNWQEAILSTAEKEESDLIVMPIPHSKGGVLSNLSDSNWAIIRRASCPVLIARSDQVAFPQKILAAVRSQTSDSNYEILNKSVVQRSKWVSGLFNAELHFVNAYNGSMDYPDRGNLLRLTNADGEHIHVHSGDVSEVICQVADEIDADTIMIGTNRRQGFSAALKGNTAEQIVRHSGKNVVIISE